MSKTADTDTKSPVMKILMLIMLPVMRNMILHTAEITAKHTDMKHHIPKRVRPLQDTGKVLIPNRFRRRMNRPLPW